MKVEITVRITPEDGPTAESTQDFDAPDVPAEDVSPLAHRITMAAVEAAKRHAHS